MTTTQELIARLRDGSETLDSTDPMVNLLYMSADHIESLSAEVERLTAKIGRMADTLSQEALARENVTAQNAELRAQLEAQGDAVAVITASTSGNRRTYKTEVIARIEDGMHELYLAPAATHPAPAWSGDPSTQDYASTQAAPAAPVVEQDRITELEQLIVTADEIIGIEPYEHVAQEAADGHRTIRFVADAVRKKAANSSQRCQTCGGTGVEGDASDDGRTIDVQCGYCDGTGKAESLYRDKCDDGHRCLQGCRKSERCYWDAKALHPTQPKGEKA